MLTFCSKRHILEQIFGSRFSFPGGELNNSKCTNDPKTGTGTGINRFFFLLCKTFYTMHGKAKHNDRVPLLKYFNITIDMYTAAPYLLVQP